MFYVSRFKDVEKREYECEVVTPLFLGGANSKEAELRVPPIKAAMRFWWRALYEGSSIDKMVEEEAVIFGSTENKAAVTVKANLKDVRVSKRDLPFGVPVRVSSRGKSFNISIIEYLAFGLLDPRRRQDKYLREYIEPESTFKIIIILPKSKEYEFHEALRCMVFFGGLGSRSRNGFGSLHCADLNVPAVRKEGELKIFTSFSKEATLFKDFNTYNTWADALSSIGKVYREARLNLEERHIFDKRNDPFLGQCPKSRIHYTTRQQLMIG